MLRNRSGRPRSAISSGGAAADRAEGELARDRGGAVVAGRVAGERPRTPSPRPGRRPRSTAAPPSVHTGALMNGPGCPGTGALAHPPVGRRDLTRAPARRRVAGVARPRRETTSARRQSPAAASATGAPGSPSATARARRACPSAGVMSRLSGVVVGHPLGLASGRGGRGLLVRREVGGCAPSRPPSSGPSSPAPPAPAVSRPRARVAAATNASGGAGGREQAGADRRPAWPGRDSPGSATRRARAGRSARAAR